MELPPWAADAQDFVAKMAEALESPHVSRSLHRWIDLIFGYRNQGQAALAADNVFHHLTYDHMCAPLQHQSARCIADTASQDLDMAAACGLACSLSRQACCLLLARSCLLQITSALQRVGLWR